MAILNIRDISKGLVKPKIGDVVETLQCHNFTCVSCEVPTCWGQNSKTWLPLADLTIDTIMESGRNKRVLRVYKAECPNCGQKYCKSTWISVEYVRNGWPDQSVKS